MCKFVFIRKTTEMLKFPLRKRQERQHKEDFLSRLFVVPNSPPVELEARCLIV